MKICKSIDIQAEVGIDLTMDDIRCIMWADGTTINDLLNAINTSFCFFKEFPEEKINEIKPEIRKRISEFLAEQAERFKVKG